jgi:hypothetical protein
MWKVAAVVSGHGRDAEGSDPELKVSLGRWTNKLSQKNEALI